MECFNLPAHAKGIIFDMDLTLYSNAEYGQAQVDLLIQKLGDLQGKPFEVMRDEVEGFRKKWSREHGGEKLSLGNAFTAFGISIEENVRWRETLYDPSKYLSPDPKLKAALSVLARNYALGVVTNNPVLVAEKTLSVLGVRNFFTAVVGLDTCMVSKPHRDPFLKALQLLNVPPEAALSVGDRYDIDIALPLELGMGGILVTGAEDVYTLPDILDGQ